MPAAIPFSSLRIALLLALPAALTGCAGLPASGPGTDFALCEQARAQARRGDTAGAEATIARIGDLRDAWFCRNYLLEIDRGLHPEGT